MVFLNSCRAIQICNGARHLRHPVSRAGGKSSLSDNSLVALKCPRMKLAPFCDFTARNSGVASDPILAKSTVLNLSGFADSLTEHFGRLPILGAKFLLHRKRFDVHVQINAIQNRPAYLLAVALYFCGFAVASRSDIEFAAPCATSFRIICEA